MRRWLMVAVAMLIAASFSAQAEQKRPDSSRKQVFISPRVLDKLSLTEDQAAKVKEISEHFERESEQWMASRKEERAALRNEIQAAKTAGDETKVEELRKKWREQFAPLAQLREQQREKLHAILTDEQRQKLAHAIAESKQRWAEQHGQKDKGEDEEHEKSATEDKD